MTKRNRENGNMRRKRARIDRSANIVSNCGGIKVRGTPEFIANEYERLGNEADGEKDHRQAQAYFQQADHYRRMVRGES